MANETSIDARLARAEERLDGHDRRLSDHDNRLNAMSAVATSVIQLVEQVGTLRRDLADYKEQGDDERADRDERDRENKRDRRAMRIAMWTLSVMILCALIGAATVILSSGGHP